MVTSNAAHFLTRLNTMRSVRHLYENLTAEIVLVSSPFAMSKYFKLAMEDEVSSFALLVPRCCPVAPLCSHAKRTRKESWSESLLGQLLHSAVHPPRVHVAHHQHQQHSFGAAYTNIVHILSLLRAPCLSASTSHHDNKNAASNYRHHDDLASHAPMHISLLFVKHLPSRRLDPGT